MADDWQAVGRDGKAFLLRKGDQGRVHDLESSPARLTEPQWLQIWFKWGEFEDCTQEEYERALQEYSLQEESRPGG